MLQQGPAYIGDLFGVGQLLVDVLGMVLYGYQAISENRINNTLQIINTTAPAKAADLRRA